MNVVFTCGGTAGHINPAIAVANIWKERHPEGKVLFIGGDDMEMELVPKAGYELVGFPSASFCRGLNMHAFRHNARAVGLITRAISKCKRVLQDFQADVVIGTGGYASFPALKMGAKLGIPTCVHESNAVPGLTTKLVARTASRVMVSFESSREHYPEPEKVLLTGTPVREEFLFAKRQEARQALGLGDEPLVVSCWGSLGAREMNKKIAQFMKLECEQDCWRHIHATGSFGWRWMPDYVKEQGVELEKHPLITMQEYIYNMPELMAAADVVISRAGASTLNEIAAAGTPCIIVPSPNVTNDHQEKNARILEQHGAAVVLHENHCDGELLFRTTQELLADAPRRASMRKALQELAVVDSASRICDIILNLAKTHKS